jgi:glycosyl transferase family 87
VSPAPLPATLGVAALSAPVLYDLNLGNVSLIVTFFAVLTWRYLDKPIGSIALAASLTMRPTMALIGGWWLLRGLWRPVVWTAIAGVAIVLATLPFVGIERWFELLTVLRNVSNVTGVRANLDLGSSVLLMGGPAWLAQVALYAGYAIAIGAVLMSLRRDRELSFVVTVMATLMLSPLLWDHYLTNLLIPAAFLASRGRWWGLALPLLVWAPPLLAVAFPGLRGIAEFVLAYVALAGLLLPFLAPDRGERAGTFLDRLAAYRAGQRTREPARA